MTKYTDDSSNFGADGPFFQIIREGLKGLADGEDYFDLLADDVVFEYVISVPGYPRRVEGRQDVIDLYSGYDDYMTVHTADNLRVYRDPEASVAVLEYEVHGESAQTGRPYNNRFVSIITVKNHKVTHWRDYLDPIAVFEPPAGPVPPHEQPAPGRHAQSRPARPAGVRRPRQRRLPAQVRIRITVAGPHHPGAVWLVQRPRSP